MSALLAAPPVLAQHGAQPHHQRFQDAGRWSSERERHFGRLRAALRPGARVAIIDFRPDSPTGPPRSGRIAPERVKAEMQRAGYRLAAEHGFLPYPYFRVFEPAAR